VATSQKRVPLQRIEVDLLLDSLLSLAFLCFVDRAS
jgi:hypothetical protein